MVIKVLIHLEVKKFLLNVVTFPITVKSARFFKLGANKLLWQISDTWMGRLEAISRHVEDCDN